MVGEKLGNYKVLEPIGTGGMASVYIGEHVVLGNRVAIKVLHARHLSNPSIERRFFNEAKAIAAIRHPSVVEIYDFGRGGPTDAAYIVMELLDGENLRARIRRGVILEREAAIFTRQIAQGLSAAHSRGIIHRDLKPDNVFLVPDPEVELGERAKVLDFGIAKHTGVQAPEGEHTAIGILVGTPAYMSPEQCRGNSTVDTRADIYSLGVVLYRMVTNQLPFEAGGTGEVLGKHMYIEPPSPRDINPSVSALMDETITRCLQKKPDDRFQSMSEFAEALWRVAASTPSPGLPLHDTKRVPTIAEATPERVYRSQSQSTDIGGPPRDMEYDIPTPGPTPINIVATTSERRGGRARSTLGDATGQVQTITPVPEVAFWQNKTWLAGATAVAVFLFWVGSRGTESVDVKAASQPKRAVPEVRTNANVKVNIPKSQPAATLPSTNLHLETETAQGQEKEVGSEDGYTFVPDKASSTRRQKRSNSARSKTVESESKRRGEAYQKKIKAKKSESQFRTPEAKF